MLGLPKAGRSVDAKFERSRYELIVFYFFTRASSECASIPRTIDLGLCVVLELTFLVLEIGKSELFVRTRK